MPSTELQGRRKIQPTNLLRSTTFLFPMILILVSVLYYLTYHNRFIYLVDEGFIVNGALRVLEGQIPLIDFYSYMPGRYYLLAGFFKVFGVTIASERMMWIVLMTIRNVLAYVVANKLFAKGVSLAIALTIALIPGMWVKTFYTLLPLLHMAFLAFYLQRRSRRSAFLLGAISGGILYFRFQFGLIALGITLGVMAIDALADRIKNYPVINDRIGQILKPHALNTLSTCSAYVLITLPFLLYLLVHPLRDLAFERLTTTPLRVVSSYYTYQQTVTPEVQTRISSPDREEIVADVVQNWLHTFFILSLLLGLLTVIHAIYFLRHLNPSEKRRYLIGSGLILWSGGMFLRFFPLPSLQTFLITGQMSWILTLWFITDFFKVSKGKYHQQRKREEMATTVGLKPRRDIWYWGRLAVFSFLSLTWLGLIAYAFHGCDVCGTWKARPENSGRLDIERAHLILEDDVAERLHTLIHTITELSSPADPIFTYRYAMLYFLADRTNATSLDNVFPPRVSTKEAQIAVGSLRRNPPMLQVIQVSQSLPFIELISGYPCDLRMTLMDGYKYYDMVGSYLIMIYEPGQSGWEALRKAYQKRGLDFNISEYICE